MTEFWNARRVSKLRSMVAEDYSASQIGAALRCSSNAVIGKCHRLGLQLRGKAGVKPRLYSKHRSPAPTRAYVPRAYVPPAALERVVEDRQVKNQQTAAHRPIEPLKFSKVVVGEVRLVDLEMHHCRWPSGESPDIAFCGEEKIEGLPYCGPHCRRAYSTAARVFTRRWT